MVFLIPLWGKFSEALPSCDLEPVFPVTISAPFLYGRRVKYRHFSTLA